PVTLGGGMTMENRGLSLSTRAWKTRFSSHQRVQRSSAWRGSYRWGMAAGPASVWFAASGSSPLVVLDWAPCVAIPSTPHKKKALPSKDERGNLPRYHLASRPAGRALRSL